MTELPELQPEIRSVLAAVAGEMGLEPGPPRDYTSARERVLAASRSGGTIGELELSAFAHAEQFEETVVALSLISALPIDAIDRIMCNTRCDPLLIMARAAGFTWQTLRALIKLQRRDVAETTLAQAHDDYVKLSPGTAQRALRFWQARNATARDAAAGPFQADAPDRVAKPSGRTPAAGNDATTGAEAEPVSA